MLLATVLACHVLAAIGVGPMFVTPFLTKMPTALRAVLVFLRFGAGATLISGILLWVVLKPVHPFWLYASSALFLVVLAAVAFGLSPATARISAEPEMANRVRVAGLASSALTVCIAVLMVLRPGDW